jgi:hypothetical protein
VLAIIEKAARVAAVSKEPVKAGEELRDVILDCAGNAKKQHK